MAPKFAMVKWGPAVGHPAVSVCVIPIARPEFATIILIVSAAATLIVSRLEIVLRPRLAAAEQGRHAREALIIVAALIARA